MKTRWLWLGLALLGACDPDDACEDGYYADHGICYLEDAATGLVPTDASASDDGGAPASDPNATFGKPCREQSDCGGVAPVCGGRDLPVCTNINCLDKPICPSGWLCIDVTKYDPPPPAGVNSVCVNL